MSDATVRMPITTSPTTPPARPSADASLVSFCFPPPAAFVTLLDFFAPSAPPVMSAIWIMVIGTIRLIPPMTRKVTCHEPSAKAMVSEVITVSAVRQSCCSFSPESPFTFVIFSERSVVSSPDELPGRSK